MVFYLRSYVRNFASACVNSPVIVATFCRCSFYTSKARALCLESSSSFSSRSYVQEVLCLRSSISACANVASILATSCRCSFYTSIASAFCLESSSSFSSMCLLSLVLEVLCLKIYARKSISACLQEPSILATFCRCCISICKASAFCLEIFSFCSFMCFVSLVSIVLYLRSYVRNSVSACVNSPVIEATFCRSSFSTSKASALCLESSSSFSTRSYVMEVLCLRSYSRNSISACSKVASILASFCRCSSYTSIASAFCLDSSASFSSMCLWSLVLEVLYLRSYVSRSIPACFNVPSIRATCCRCCFSTSRASAFYLESSSSFTSRSL